MKNPFYVDRATREEFNNAWNNFIVTVGKELKLYSILDFLNKLLTRKPAE